MRSDLEIVYRDLHVGHDRLRRGFAEIPLKEVRLDGAELLIRGGRKTRWRIPVDESTGAALLTAIEARAR